MSGGTTTNQNQTTDQSGSSGYDFSGNKTTTGNSTTNTNENTSDNFSENSTQDQTFYSKTDPWAGSRDALARVQALLKNDALGKATGGQLSAIDALKRAAGGIYNFGDDANSVAKGLLAGGNAKQYAGDYERNLADLRARLAPTADGSVNPMDDPSMRAYLDTITSDIKRGTNSQWAAAGRDLSAGHAQALSRGVSQGTAGILTEQYNRNVANKMNAANELYGAGYGTAGALTGLNAQENQNRLMGLGAASAANELSMNPARQQWNAANLEAMLPYQSIAQYQDLANKLAGVGSETSGSTRTTGTRTGTRTGTKTGTQTKNYTEDTDTSGSSSGTSSGSSSGNGTSTTSSPWWTTALGGGLGLLSLFSDENLKEDIKPVGLLFDGQKVHSYRYKGDPVVRIGLLAQEVERTKPEAVTDNMRGSGFKGVDYDKATADAARLAA